MTELYRFSREAYWERPRGGPLVTPTFDNPRKDDSKESALDFRWIDYLQRLNPDYKAFEKLIAPDWGPTKGINKNGKLRFIHLVYPGYGNYVEIIRIENGFGMLRSLSLTSIPNMIHNWISSPNLIHKVYGSNGKGTPDLLSHAPYVPVLGDSRWVEMKWLERIDNARVDVRPKAWVQPVYSFHSCDSPINNYLHFMPTVTVTNMTIGEDGLWGECIGGWIPLRYRGSQMTNWRI
jgi:hypothetical protein